VVDSRANNNCQQKLQFDSSLTTSVDQQITDHALQFTDNAQMQQL
jgi:hypothetical protein